MIGFTKALEATNEEMLFFIPGIAVQVDVHTIMYRQSRRCAGTLPDTITVGVLTDRGDCVQLVAQNNTVSTVQYLVKVISV